MAIKSASCPRRAPAERGEGTGGHPDTVVMGCACAVREVRSIEACLGARRIPSRVRRTQLERA